MSELVRGIRQRLRRRYTDEQRTDQAGTISHRDCVHIFKAHIRLLDASSTPDRRSLHMGADAISQAQRRRTSRAAESETEMTGGNHLLRSIADDGSRRFITAGFNRQNRRMPGSLQPLRLLSRVLFVIHASFSSVNWRRIIPETTAYPPPSAPAQDKCARKAAPTHQPVPFPKQGLRHHPNEDIRRRIERPVVIGKQQPVAARQTSPKSRTCSSSPQNGSQIPAPKYQDRKSRTDRHRTMALFQLCRPRR